MTKLSAEQLAKNILQKRIKIKSDLHAWCEHALQPLGMVPAKHHKIIIQALEEVERGDCDRLIISLPPGSAKSTYASVLYPAWFLARNPNKNVVLASYAASLAENFSAQTKNMILDNAADLDISIQVSSNAVERWSLTNGSKYRCVGAGSGITGFRADLIIIDDPIKGRAEADSPAARENLWRWYRSDLFTRLKPKGKIVLIMTRWHPDDIAGRLLEDHPEEWKVINLPALCDDPETDLLERELGEPLWPEWQSLEELQRVRRTVGEREFCALYQQKPTPDGGALIQYKKLEDTISLVQPTYIKSTVVRAWDIAATSTYNARNPDFTAGVLMVRDENGRFMVTDVVKIQGEPYAVEQLIFDTAKKDGPGVYISIPQDPGAAGKSYSQYITRMLAGYDIHSSRETGNKIQRATGFIAQINGGNVTLLNGTWNRDYIDELSCFPAGLRDDQVDASSRAFNLLVDKNKKPIEFINFNWMSR